MPLGKITYIVSWPRDSKRQTRSFAQVYGFRNGILLLIV